MNDYSRELSQLDDDYESIEVEQNRYDDIPDGKYQVKIDRISIEESKNNNLMLRYVLKILNGNYTGRLLFKNTMIIPDTLKYLKQEISICQIECKKLSDLQNKLTNFLDIMLEVTKKTKGEYENIYFNRKITLNNIEYDKTYIPDDDIPF